MKISQFISIQFLLCLILFAGCSFHFDQGRKLEAEERWEEAAIEYRRAYVDDPDDSEVQEALQRVNRKVARGNLERYREYLDKRALVEIPALQWRTHSRSISLCPLRGILSDSHVSNIGPGFY